MRLIITFRYECPQCGLVGNQRLRITRDIPNGILEARLASKKYLEYIGGEALQEIIDSHLENMPKPDQCVCDACKPAP